MSELRNKVQLKIKNTIQKSRYFTLDDFEINFNPTYSYLVVITFIAYPPFTFRISEEEVEENIKSRMPMSQQEYKTKNVIQTIECPGDFKEHETKNFDDIGSCLYRIGKWVDNLYEDLQLIDSKDKDTTNDTKKFKEKLDKHFNDIEKFNSDEIIKLKNLLDELNNKVEELEKDLKLNSDEAKFIINIVKDSKSHLELLPKKAWFLATWNKLKNIDSKIKTMLGFKDSLFDFIEYTNKLFN